jgi:SAM-dependent methyltransferase
MTKALDLGCGNAPKNFFGALEVFGVDVREDLENNIVRVDLALEPIPFSNDYFDFVTAHDVLEHIPRVIYAPHHRYPFVELMNEIWRCLKIGGKFLSVTPAFPQPAAFVDPTHVNIITEQTFPLYFDDQNRWANGYGFKGAFRVLSQKWHGSHLVSVLEKTHFAIPQETAQQKQALSDSTELNLRENSELTSSNLRGLPTEIQGGDKKQGSLSSEAKTSDDLHQTHWNDFFESELHQRLYHSWFSDNTVNHWRHVRFLEGVLGVLQARPASWLLVGDGGGHDSWILINEGYSNILSTDIGVETLKICLDEGKIQKFDKVNAERMQYGDDAFEFILCKDALHHMRRPYQAVYEMLRVASRAVVVIEPQDPYIDPPTVSGPAQQTWERVGNYVYGFSVREFQKVAYGLNLPGFAVKNICDLYIEGCEFHEAIDGEPFFENLRSAIAEAEARCHRSEAKWNYVMAIFFKVEPNEIRDGLISSLGSMGWTYEKTNLNPYLE